MVTAAMKLIRHLILGREAMTNLDSVLKSRDITLLTKVHVVRKCWGFHGYSDDKESACKAGNLGSILGLGSSPEEGNGNPLQYSYLENSSSVIMVNCIYLFLKVKPVLHS